MHRLRTFLIAGALAVLSAGGMHVTGALDSLEQNSVDLRFGLKADERPAEVVVVAVDDVTFSDLNWQWPFRRSAFAKVADRLHAAGAREIVFDIQFTEPSAMKEDWALFQSVDRAGGAVLATSESDGKGGHKVLGGEDNLRSVGATAAASNLPDDDAGVVRRFEADVDGLPSIAAAVAARAGRPIEQRRLDRGAAWIDYQGAPGSVRTVSFSSLYKGRVDPAVFRDKIVVVGASAPTMQDVHPTSISRRELMSGPEIQANAIVTALRGLPLQSAPGWLAIVSILLLSAAVPLAAVRFSPLASALTGVAVGAAYVGAVALAFGEGVMVVAAAPLVGLLVATVGTTVGGQLVERRERRRVAEHNDLLEAAVRERTADLDALQREIIERLGQAVDSRDEETGEHIHRIGTLSHQLALAVGMDVHRAEMMRRASAMHDVGKVAIPDSILQHPGPLSPEQRRVMETHTTIGAKILAGSRSPLVQMAEVIALTHHEKWNGRGYPHGLAGEEIPLEGRVVAVCDVFDALVSRRPYKEPWTTEDALAEIENSAGSHFDPVVAKAFLEVMRADVPAANTGNFAFTH